MGLRSLFESRTVYNDSTPALWDREFPTLEAARRTFSGKRVNQDIARTMTAVFFCQSLIVDGVGTLPVDHFQKKDGRRETVESGARWLTEPNPYQTGVEFWSRVMSSLLSDGNAFIATIRNDRGIVIHLYCLDPKQVAIEIDPANKVEKRFRIAGELFDKSQVLHIPGFVVADSARGLSPIDVARESIGLGLTIEEYASRFFAQGTSMAGIIEHPGTPQPDEAQMLQRMFRKTHAGVKNSHAIGILTGGASFKPITMSNEQAQFLESRRLTNEQIALLYRVPAYMVNPSVTSTWGTGIEEQNKFLVDYTLAPWAIRIEAAVSRFLLPGNQFMKFNFDARLRAKTKERYEAYQKAIDAGFMCIDDARALEDLPPLPDGQGQIFWRPLNMAPIEFAIANAENAAKPQPEPAPNDEPADDPDADNEQDDNDDA